MKKANITIMADPDAPATSPIDEKIPEPMVVPIDIATAAHKPNFLLSSLFSMNFSLLFNKLAAYESFIDF